MHIGILTVSDRAARGDYPDLAGPFLRDVLADRLQAEIDEYAVVPDEFERIKRTLIDWSDDRRLQLILTTGGTGFSPRDVTPEATLSVIQREASGLARAMLQAGLKSTPHAMLSRAAAGIRGSTLIVNLPGSPKAAQESLETILPVLPHAIDLITDSPGAADGHSAVQSSHNTVNNSADN